MRGIVPFVFILLLGGSPLLPVLAFPADSVSESKGLDEFSLPTAGLQPLGIAADAAGNIWFGASAVSGIFRFNPQDNTFEEFDYPGGANKSEVWGITVAKNGAIWFGETVTNAIWVLDVASRSFKSYSIPTKDAYPFQLSFASDGTLWFTELYGGKIGKLSPSDGIILEFRTPSLSSGPSSFDFDGQGNMWIAEQYSRQVAYFRPSSGEFNERKLPSSMESPRGIAVDEEGRVWVSDSASDSLMTYDPKSNLTVSYATSPSSVYDHSSPYLLKKGPNHHLWFNERTGNSIGRVDTAKMSMVEIELSYLSRDVLPIGYVPPDCCLPIAGTSVSSREILSVAVDLHGDLWFSESLGGMLGRVRSDFSPSLNANAPSNLVSIKAGVNVTLELAISTDSSSGTSVWITNDISATPNDLLLQPMWNNPISVAPDHFERVSLVIVPSSTLLPGHYGVSLSVKDGSVAVTSLITLVYAKESSGPGGSDILFVSAATIAIALAAALLYVKLTRRRTIVRIPRPHPSE